MVGAVDFADAQGRLAFGAWNAHFTLVVHTIGCVRFIFMRESVAVPGDLCHRVITRDEPESAVLLIPRHRTPVSKLGVDLRFVEVELVRVMIEINDHIGADIRTRCHRKILQHKEVCEICPSGAAASLSEEFIALSLRF